MNEIAMTTERKPTQRQLRLHRLKSALGKVRDFIVKRITAEEKEQLLILLSDGNFSKEDLRQAIIFLLTK